MLLRRKKRNQESHEWGWNLKVMKLSQRLSKARILTKTFWHFYTKLQKDLFCKTKKWKKIFCSEFSLIFSKSKLFPQKTLRNQLWPLKVGNQHIPVENSFFFFFKLCKSLVEIHGYNFNLVSTILFLPHSSWSFKAFNLFLKWALILFKQLNSLSISKFIVGKESSINFDEFHFCLQSI